MHLTIIWKYFSTLEDVHSHPNQCYNFILFVLAKTLL